MQKYLIGFGLGIILVGANTPNIWGREVLPFDKAGCFVKVVLPQGLFVRRQVLQQDVLEQIRGDLGVFPRGSNRGQR